MKALAVQKEMVEARALLQLGREEQALARQRAAERDRGDFQKAQMQAARARTERRARLRSAAFGESSLLAPAVMSVPAVAGASPCAPQEVWLEAFSTLRKGDWNSACGLPLRGLENIGNTCFANACIQLLMRIPALVEWMNEHSKNCVQHARCALCSLHDTRLQVLVEARHAPRPVLAERLALLDQPLLESLANSRQHDAVEFVDRFLNQIRGVERQAARAGAWSRVEIDDPVATQGERIFGFVRETRRRCTRCSEGVVRSWYGYDRVLRIAPDVVGDKAITTSELYYASCGPQEDARSPVECARCGRRTVHVEQTRLFSSPNVLLMQVGRKPGPERTPVHVEEQLDLPGLSPMELVGVIYHAGHTMTTGHYTSLCRGPRGGFWYFDDSDPVPQMLGDVGQIKPREVYMVAYCRRGGVAEMQDRPPEALVVEDVVSDEEAEVARSSADAPGSGPGS